MNSKKVVNYALTGDISAQILGLTDQHIHFFEQTGHQQSLGIHHLMLDGFQSLVNSATNAGIEIKIASGFRSFERQLFIWNNKFMGKTAIKNMAGDSVNISQLNEVDIIKAILLFSALPGASRHHWGCDIDIYAENLLNGQSLKLEPWEYASNGPMAKLTTWLRDNAAKHGFYFPYDEFRGGVAAEPWHLSYVPLAKQYQSLLNSELLKTLLEKTDVSGKTTIIENLPTIFKQYINNIKTIDY